jgi:hypothetical protein
MGDSMTIPPPAQPGQPVGPPPYSAPPTKSKKTLYIVLGIVVALLALCGGCGAMVMSGANEVATSVDEALASPSPTSAEPAAEVGVGKAARDGNFQFTVTRVRCGQASIGTNPYLTKKAQGQFCTVTMTVKNIKAEPQTLSDSDQKAFVGGASYDADTEAGMYVNGNESSVLFNTINPGNAVTGKIVFDIPKGAKLTTLELHDSAFSGGVTVTL